MTAILPDIDDPDTAPFWEAARRGRLVVQRCGQDLIFPPRPGSPDATWQEVSGRGSIWSFIVVHAPTLPAFADKVPFPVAVIELEEAPHLRMVGNLVAAPGAAVNSVAPETVAIGQKVVVSFEQIADEIFLPCWVPTP